MPSWDPFCEWTVKDNNNIALNTTYWEKVDFSLIKYRNLVKFRISSGTKDRVGQE